MMDLEATMMKRWLVAVSRLQSLRTYTKTTCLQLKQVYQSDGQCEDDAVGWEQVDGITGGHGTRTSQQKRTAM